MSRLLDRRTLEPDWHVHEAAKTQLLRGMSVRASLREFVAIQAEYAEELDRSERLYREGRIQYLRTLQERLERLNIRRGNTVNQLVRSVVALQARLEKAGIPSMVVGGMAVSVWGEPRLTRDIDLKVLLTRDASARLIKALGREYKSLHGDPGESFREAGFAFFVDRTGTRVDLLLSDNAFDDTALSRAVLVSLGPRKNARVCTAEDLIVYKMLSDRPRDRADAESVVHRQGRKLDHAFVERWLREFERVLDDSTLVSGYRRIRKKLR